MSAEQVTASLSIPKLADDISSVDAALAYAEAGWYVGPVARSDPKNPGSVLGKGWQHKTTRDRNTIIALWFGTDHGVFLHAGRSGAGIIDMDYPEKCPSNVLEALKHSWAPFQSTRVDSDSRGHYVFRQPAGRFIGNSLGTSFQDCGFEVRGNNGVIIAAPSIHEFADQGGRYQWELTGAVPMLPAIIADKLPDASEATEAVSDEQMNLFLESHTEETRPAILHGHLKSFQKRMGELGSRHDAMVSPLTGAMKEVAAGFYSGQRALLAMWEPFLAAKSKPFNGKPAMTEAAARADFDGILSWAIGQALTADPDETRRRVAKEMPPQPLSAQANPSWEFLSGKASAGADNTESAAPQDNPWGTVPGDTFILDQPANVPAIWGTGNRILWPEGEGLMIAGSQGVGKTGIAGQLVRELLGLGTGELFGLPVEGSGEVILYLAMDRPRQIARSMARQFSEEERDTLRARLIIRPGPPPADLAKDPELLLRMASGVGARIVFIDSLKDAALGLSDDEVGASYNRARQHLLAAGYQLCDLHHCVKRNSTGGPPMAIADIYGSTWLTSGCGSVLLISGDPGDPIVKLRHLKQAVDEIGPLTLTQDRNTGMFSVTDEIDLVKLADFGEGGVAEGVTARAAACALFDIDKPTASQVEKARRRLDEYVETGRLQRREGGRGKAGAARWFPTGR